MQAQDRRDFRPGDIVRHATRDGTYKIISELGKNTEKRWEKRWLVENLSTGQRINLLEYLLKDKDVSESPPPSPQKSNSVLRPGDIVKYVHSPVLHYTLVSSYTTSLGTKVWHVEEPSTKSMQTVPEALLQRVDTEDVFMNPEGYGSIANARFTDDAPYSQQEPHVEPRNYSREKVLNRARKLLDEKKAEREAFDKHRVEGAKKLAEALNENPNLDEKEFLDKHRNKFDGGSPLLHSPNRIFQLEQLIEELELVEDDTVHLNRNELLQLEITI